MSRTLKEDTTKPPAASLCEQRSRFDNFRDEFNNERPIRLPRTLPESTHPKGLLLTTGGQ
jgi:hypothetical protein